MTTKDHLEQQLRELSEAINTDEKFAGNVMSKIHATSGTGKAGAGRVRRFIMRHSLTKIAAAAVIGFVAWIAIGYLGDSVDNTSKVYAAMIEALDHVSTVHVTGWTTRIQSHHTTINDMPYDNSKRYPIEIWEWFTEDGAHRMFERQGPITIWYDGNLRYEYQANKDTLYIDTHKLPSLLPDKFQLFTREVEPFITRHGDLTSRLYRPPGRPRH